jgi:hypothetical protein
MRSLEMMTLYLAFAINFILLFHRVNVIEGGAEFDGDDNGSGENSGSGEDGGRPGAGGADVEMGQCLQATTTTTNL